MSKGKKKLRVIPLGGLQEIGKNVTVFEYDDDMIVVDCGISFPEEDMLGIDLVIPDVTYLIKNKERIRGIFLTHGHEDHIGALPYVLRDLKVAVYGTRLTMGLLSKKLEEYGLKGKTAMRVVSQGQTIEAGAFKVEFIRSTHSIADSTSFAIHTPIGVVVHTSDFKIDHTPIGGEGMDLARFAVLGNSGVLLLMSESTNVEREGYTMSEKTVGVTFQRLFQKAKGRILVATFASNIHRMQQAINGAVELGRKVAVCGRSMENVIDVAMDLGYLGIPEGTLIDIEEVGEYREDELLIMTTGSQGEPMSALSRIAASDHRTISIIPGDLVIISANPIPGNEKFISKVINELYKKGAEVIYEAIEDIHVSGHACQEELKLIYSLTKPRYFMPVHGEYRHLWQHARMIGEMGLPEKDIYVMENGQVLELTANSAKLGGNVQAGRILVDGHGVGDVGAVVLRDRKLLSQDGLIIVVITVDEDDGGIISGPEIISRGFVYVKESEDLMDSMRSVIENAVRKAGKVKRGEWGQRKNEIREALRDFIYSKTKRKPMILPIIMEA